MNTDIPEDVMKAAQNILDDAEIVGIDPEMLIRADIDHATQVIAHAIMSARDKALEDAAERVQMRAVFLSGKASADHVQGMLEAAAILVLKEPKP